MSKNELMLKEFFELNAVIKEKQKRLDELKVQIKEKGSFSTTSYMACVDLKTRKVLDSDKVKEILKDNTPYLVQSYETVSVKMKGLL